MTAFGLGPDGYRGKTLAEIRAELNDLARSPDYFGPDAAVGDEDHLGKLLGIWAEREAALWEAAQQLYDAFDLDAATGVQLDALASLLGLTREEAALASGPLILTGIVGAVVPAGSLARRGAVPEQTVTLQADSAPFAAAAAWTPITSWSIGDVRTSDGAIWYVITAGLGLLVAPNGDGPTFVDGIAVWRRVGTGTAYVLLNAVAEQAGEFEAAAWEINEILTPRTGWQGVDNPEDWTPGSEEESDADFRDRIEVSRQISGVGTDGAIRARLLELEFVDEALVISNRTDVALPSGQPPHSFRAVLWPDTLGPLDEDEVARRIFRAMPAGIRPWGAETRTVEDSQGLPQTVAWDYAEEVPAYVRVEYLDTEGSLFPADYVARTVAAVVALAAEQRVGEPFRHHAVIGAVVAAVPGVVDLTVKIGTTSPPTQEATLFIDDDQIVTVQAAAVTVIPPP